MICYPADAAEVEIAVINDYWLVPDESSTEFVYALKQIVDIKRHSFTKFAFANLVKYVP